MQFPMQSFTEVIAGETISSTQIRNPRYSIISSGKAFFFFCSCIFHCFSSGLVQGTIIVNKISLGRRSFISCVSTQILTNYFIKENKQLLYYLNFRQKQSTTCNVIKKVTPAHLFSFQFCCFFQDSF